MTTLHRTLLTFAAFLVNYGLVISVHPAGIEPLEWVVVWLICLLMGAVSFIQWDASYFFGSYVYAHGIMTVAKGLLTWQAGLSLLIMVVMTLSLGGFSWLASIGESVKRSLGTLRERLAALTGHLFGGWSRSRVLKQLRARAQVKAGGERLSEEDVAEFQAVELDGQKVRRFFDGSDPTLERGLSSVLPQVETLQRDHARLLLRGEHLQNLLSSEPRGPIEEGIRAMQARADALQDPVSRAQVEKAIAIKSRRIGELETLKVCLDRVQTQRLQICETVHGLFNRLNALKFSDIQTLEATRDAISEEVRELSEGIDSLQNGLLAAYRS